MKVRRLLHALGYRFRLHRRDLPGSPDIVLPRLRSVIFVHGCFWHRHDDPDCRLARMPKSRIEFWAPKLLSNQLRDERVQQELEALGWRVLVVWECEVKDQNGLRRKIVGFIGPKGGAG